MKPVFLFIFALILLGACKKDNTPRFCWQVLDNLGNELISICDKTEDELKECVRTGACNININNGNLGPCNYYKIEGEKFCWMLNGAFVQNQSQTQINHTIQCFGSGTWTATKVACDYCKKWYTREKRTYKPTNSFNYSSVEYRFFCGDTVRTLFHGRQVIRKDNADSLIVVQFSDNGQF